MAGTVKGRTLSGDEKTLIFHPARCLRTIRGAYAGRYIGTFHGSWLQHGCHFKASKTRAAPNTSSGSAKAPREASRLRQGLVTVWSQVPRRALEIQPYRGVGQCVD